jgi:hypothetical protein
MIIITKEKPSHWYLPSGQPFHEVAAANGSGMRPVTLRDARKVGAYPSVTNVLNILSKPGLDAWKIEQGILAALTLPRNPGETDTDFAARVVVDMDSHVEHAMDRGTEIHAAAEDFLRNGKVTDDATLKPLIEPFVAWAKENVLKVHSLEDVVVHKALGYAGRVDFVAEIKGLGVTVVDLKTQRVKLDKKGQPKPNFYESWPMQLAAYLIAIEHMGSFHQPAHIASLVLGSEEPVAAQFKVWEAPIDHFNAFRNALMLWQYTKDYRPGQEEIQCAA